MAGGTNERGSRRPTRTASVVVPFPRGVSDARLDLARFVPSGRSLLLAFAIVVGAAAGYWAAYASPIFAVERIDVRGAPPQVARDVARATRELVGTSLVAVDADGVEGKLRTLPSVAGVSVDRAFPHTLVVKIAPEKPVAVVRRGRTTWLATGSGKLVREIESGTHLEFPRLWLAKGVAVRTGGMLPPGLTPAARALAEARSFGIRVKGVRLVNDELVLALRRGTELRLGRTAEVGLKLAIAAKVLRLVDSGVTYVDVSVPERPVAG